MQVKWWDIVFCRVSSCFQSYTSLLIWEKTHFIVPLIWVHFSYPKIVQTFKFVFCFLSLEFQSNPQAHSWQFIFMSTVHSLACRHSFPLLIAIGEIVLNALTASALHCFPTQLSTRVNNIMKLREPSNQFLQSLTRQSRAWSQDHITCYTDWTEQHQLNRS